MDNSKPKHYVRKNLSIMFFTKSIVFLLILCILSIIEAINNGTIPSYIAVMLVGMSVLYLYIGIALSTYKIKKVE